jgi:hypothetical protein
MSFQLTSLRYSQGAPAKNTYLTNYEQNAYLWTFWNFLDFHLGYQLPTDILKKLFKN